jgi:hypothetical protein
VTAVPVGTAPGFSVAPAPLAVAAGSDLAGEEEDAGFDAGLAAGFDGVAAAGFDATVAGGFEAADFEAALAAGFDGFAAADFEAALAAGFAGFAAADVEAALAAGFAAAGLAALARAGFFARPRPAARLAAAFRRGVARPVETAPAVAVAAAPFAALAGVEGAGASSSPRLRPATPRPATTALRPSSTAESIRFRGVRGIRAVCPLRLGLSSECAVRVGRAGGKDVRVAAGERERLGGREALPHGTAGRDSQRPGDLAGQRVEVEAQLQFASEEVLSPLPRGVHLGQNFRGRAGEEVVNKRGAGHQGGGGGLQWFGEGLAHKVIVSPEETSHGVGTPSAKNPLKTVQKARQTAAIPWTESG